MQGKYSVSKLDQQRMKILLISLNVISKMQHHIFYSHAKKHAHAHTYMHVCVCACLCACVRARVRARAPPPPLIHLHPYTHTPPIVFFPMIIASLVGTLSSAFANLCHVSLPIA